MNFNAIDVSRHQGSFNPERAKANGVGAVILRHAYGTSPDTLALGWAGGVKAQGMKLGGYGFATWHYTSVNGKSIETARAYMRAQVGRWIELAKQAGADGWWFAIDQELEQGQSMGLGMNTNTTLLNEAAGLLKNAGLHPCLYCSVAWEQQWIAQSLAMPRWLARYYIGSADFGDAGAEIEKLPAGSYTARMRALKNDAMLAGWQFGSTGNGPKYGAGSANLDKSVFYMEPVAAQPAQQDKPAVAAQREAAYIAVGPMTGGDVRTVERQLDGLQIGHEQLPRGNEAIVLTTVPCTSGDQAALIATATGLAVRVQLLNMEEAAALRKPAEAPESPQKPAEEYTVVFLGAAIKGGFATAEDAQAYIEAVLGTDAVQVYGMKIGKGAQ